MYLSPLHTQDSIFISRELLMGFISDSYMTVYIVNIHQCIDYKYIYIYYVYHVSNFLKAKKYHLELEKKWIEKYTKF